MTFVCLWQKSMNITKYHISNIHIDIPHHTENENKKKEKQEKKSTNT